MERTSERINPDHWEDFPVKEPMVPKKDRTKPSTDQRKVRRRIRNNADHRDTVIPSNSERDTVLRSWGSRERVDGYRTADRPCLLHIRAQQVIDALEGS